VKATFPVLVISVLLALLGATPTPAQPHLPIPPAPDMCGPGYFAPNNYGLFYGPNYYVYPPFQPFQGMVWAPKRPVGPHQGPIGAGGAGGPGGPGGAGNGAPAMNSPYGPAGFAVHPFNRSPRDFFMVD